MSAVIVAAFVGPAIALRRVDSDEGYYALSAKLVAHGKAPYADFWFQQAPLMPYVYGALDRVFGESWYLLRALSVGFTIGLGGLLYTRVYKISSSKIHGLCAVTLFATTPLVFQWMPSIKTYALSTLLLFGAYLCAEACSVAGWAAAGVLLGLAIDTRLLFASVIVVFVLYARHRIRWFALGLATGLLPLLGVFAIGPSRFVNDALSSQTSRSHESLTMNIDQKIHAAGGVLAEPHFFVLAVAAGVLVVFQARHRHAVSFAFAIALMLAATNLVPTPTYGQYFVTLVPFLAVTGMEFVSILQIARPGREGRISAVLALVVTFSVAGSLSSAVLSRTTPHPADLRAISKAINGHIRGGEVVLASWPGYVYESHAQQLPGLESDFEVSAVVDTHISSDRTAAYRMISADGVVRAIRAHVIRVVIFGRGDLDRYEPWQRIIAGAGYRPVESLYGATIYVYPPNSK